MKKHFIKKIIVAGAVLLGLNYGSAVVNTANTNVVEPQTVKAASKKVNWKKLTKGQVADLHLFRHSTIKVYDVDRKYDSHDIVVAAIKGWNGFLTNEKGEYYLRFKQVNSKKKADIIVSDSSRDPYKHKDFEKDADAKNTEGITWQTGSGNHLRSYVYINYDRIYNYNYDHLDYAEVSTVEHELGHAIGLADTKKYTSIMWWQDDEEKGQFSKYDYNNIKNLYGPINDANYRLYHKMP